VCLSALEDEGEDETKNGQRLGDRHAGEGDGLEHAASLGLASHTVDVGGEDQTDTDAGADRGEAVAEEGDVASHVRVPFDGTGTSSRCLWGYSVGSCAGAGSRGSVVLGDRVGDVEGREQGEDERLEELDEQL